jgi:hypothetical protein
MSVAQASRQASASAEAPSTTRTVIAASRSGRCVVAFAPVNSARGPGLSPSFSRASMAVAPKGLAGQVFSSSCCSSWTSTESRAGGVAEGTGLS